MIPPWYQTLLWIFLQILQTIRKSPFAPRKSVNSLLLSTKKPFIPSDSSQSVATLNSTWTITKNRRRAASQSTRVLPQIIKSLSVNGEIENVLHHLPLADSLLGSLIDTLPFPAFESHQLPFLALCKSTLFQQLAYKAGTSIYTRFVSLCGGDDVVCPDVVLSLSAQQLKQIGISERKTSYLYDLANKYKTGILSDDTVVKMDDRSLFTMLSMVKGIGYWSVHMFMIFFLQRPDVLPVGDLGVRKGVKMLYGLEELPRPSQMEQLFEKWRPYRSIGAWYMWQFIEGKGTPTTGWRVVCGPCSKLSLNMRYNNINCNFWSLSMALAALGFAFGAND